MDAPPLKILYHRIREALDLRPLGGSKRGAIKICSYTPDLVRLRLKDGRKWLRLDFREEGGRIYADIFLERDQGAQQMLPGVDYISGSAKSDLIKLNDSLDGALPHFFRAAILSFVDDVGRL
jgi:hypothetical protein